MRWAMMAVLLLAGCPKHEETKASAGAIAERKPALVKSVGDPGLIEKVTWAHLDPHEAMGERPIVWSDGTTKKGCLVSGGGPLAGWYPILQCDPAKHTVGWGVVVPLGQTVTVPKVAGAPGARTWSVASCGGAGAHEVAGPAGPSLACGASVWPIAGSIEALFDGGYRLLAVVRSPDGANVELVDFTSQGQAPVDVGRDLPPAGTTDLLDYLGG